jgi:hypothetical protein
VRSVTIAAAVGVVAPGASAAFPGAATPAIFGLP